MDKTAFSLLHAMEDSWWYRGRALVVGKALSVVARVPGRAFDVGAGFGGMAATLLRYASELDGTEPDQGAREKARARGYMNIYADLSAAHPPYDLIAIFDVLEHVADDVAFLDELRGALADDGSLVLTVPAFPWLWSEHDVSHHHFRRYTRRSLRAALERSGFEVSFLSYWNMFLFIPAAIVRMLGGSGAASLALPHFLDALFYAVVRAESLLLPALRLPFGTGIIAVVRKTKAPRTSLNPREV